eukprot:scaffold323791_cov38-Prasinocladus_malaysianus.AAC.1
MIATKGLPSEARMRLVATRAEGLATRTSSESDSLERATRDKENPNASRHLSSIFPVLGCRYPEFLYFELALLRLMATCGAPL